MTRGLLLLLLLPAAGCQNVPSAITRSGTPLARASDGATAAVILISCPSTLQGGQVLADLIQSLASQGELAIATDGGTARVTINACPGGLPELPPPVPTTRRR